MKAKQIRQKRNRGLTIGFLVAVLTLASTYTPTVKAAPDSQVPLSVDYHFSSSPVQYFTLCVGEKEEIKVFLLRDITLSNVTNTSYVAHARIIGEVINKDVGVLHPSQITDNIARSNTFSPGFHGSDTVTWADFVFEAKSPGDTTILFAIDPSSRVDVTLGTRMPLRTRQILVRVEQCYEAYASGLVGGEEQVFDKKAVCLRGGEPFELSGHGKAGFGGAPAVGGVPPEVGESFGGIGTDIIFLGKFTPSPLPFSTNPGFGGEKGTYYYASMVIARGIPEEVYCVQSGGGEYSVDWFLGGLEGDLILLGSGSYVCYARGTSALITEWTGEEEGRIAFKATRDLDIVCQ